MVEYEWDEQKRLRNIDKHGYDFADIELFDWFRATVFEDSRQDYKETRYLAYGYTKERFTVVIFTIRSNRLRIISWRNANARERKRYG